MLIYGARNNSWRNDIQESLNFVSVTLAGETMLRVVGTEAWLENAQERRDITPRCAEALLAEIPSKRKVTGLRHVVMQDDVRWEVDEIIHPLHEVLLRLTDSKGTCAAPDWMGSLVCEVPAAV
jgi:CYTH domain-containing protein